MSYETVDPHAACLPSLVAKNPTSLDYDFKARAWNSELASRWDATYSWCEWRNLGRRYTGHPGGWSRRWSYLPHMTASRSKRSSRNPGDWSRRRSYLFYMTTSRHKRSSDVRPKG